MRASAAGWPDHVFQLLKDHGISTVATVPDARLTKLLELFRADAGVRVVTLSSEEEGIGLGLGTWLGHVRLLLCVQSSGTGNCINALALSEGPGCAMKRPSSCSRTEALPLIASPARLRNLLMIALVAYDTPEAGI